MTLNERLDKINLAEKLRGITEEKFLTVISLPSDKQIEEDLEFLNGKGIEFKTVKDNRVLCIPVSELIKKYGILAEINETDIYVDDPSTLCLNVIDIYKRIKYCIANNVSYKENGKYAPFLKSEKLWQSEVLSSKMDYSTDKVEAKEEPVSIVVEPTPVVEEPKVPETVPLVEESNTVSFSKLVDASELKEKEDILAKTTNFKALQDDLRKQKKELEKIAPEAGIKPVEETLTEESMSDTAKNVAEELASLEEVLAATEQYDLNELQPGGLGR